MCGQPELMCILAQITASALGRKTMFSSMSAHTADEADGVPDDGPSSARKVQIRRVNWVLPGLVL